MSQTPETTPTGARPHQPDEDRFHAIRSEDVQWRSFPAFPPEARLAVLVGDPTKPGPYVIRVKLPAGTKMMPHEHPEDRIYTVLSGVFLYRPGRKSSMRPSLWPMRRAVSWSFPAASRTSTGPNPANTSPRSLPSVPWALATSIRPTIRATAGNREPARGAVADAHCKSDIAEIAAGDTKCREFTCRAARASSTVPCPRFGIAKG